MLAGSECRTVHSPQPKFMLAFPHIKISYQHTPNKKKWRGPQLACDRFTNKASPQSNHRSASRKHAKDHVRKPQSYHLQLAAATPKSIVDSCRLLHIGRTHPSSTSINSTSSCKGTLVDGYVGNTDATGETTELIALHAPDLVSYKMIRLRSLR